MGDPVKKPVMVHKCSASVREVRTKVASKSKPGKTHTVLVKGRDVEIHCDCPSFKYRGSCSHVAVTDQECGWNSGRSAVKQTEPGVCPICGSMTEQVLSGR